MGEDWVASEQHCGKDRDQAQYVADAAPFHNRCNLRIMYGSNRRGVRVGIQYVCFLLTYPGNMAATVMVSASLHFARRSSLHWSP